MITIANVHVRSVHVVRRPRGIAHLMDVLCDEAAVVLGEAFRDVSGKKIDAAAVPDVGRHGISRAINGSRTNPLFRLAGMFVLMKQMGLGRDRAQRLVDHLQDLVDMIWPPEDVPALEEVLEAEQDLDAEDDPHQQRIGRDPGALERMLEAKCRQRAHDGTVIVALKREIANQTAG